MNRPPWREVGRERRQLRVIIHLTQDNGINAIVALVADQGVTVTISTVSSGRDLRGGAESARMLAWMCDRAAADETLPFDAIAGSVTHGIVGYVEECRALVLEYFGIEI